MKATSKRHPEVKYSAGQSKSLRLQEGAIVMSPSDFSVGALQSEVLEIQGAIELLKKKLKSLTANALPALALQELHDSKSGRIDAQKTADFMGIPLKQLSEGLGLNYKAVHRSPSAAGFQQALRPVKRCLDMLHEFFGSAETIRVWLILRIPISMGRPRWRRFLKARPARCCSSWRMPAMELPFDVARVEAPKRAFQNQTHGGSRPLVSPRGVPPSEEGA